MRPYTRHVHSVASRFRSVVERVARAALAVGRDPADVQVLVATKTQDAAAIREVVGAGARLIGENRVQELTAKAPALADLVEAGLVEPHLIGHLQKNKVNHALRDAAGIDSVDSLALATALSTRCARDGRLLPVQVQVNVSGEESKSGVSPEAAIDLALEIGALPGLRVAGFMTIGANTTDESVVRAGFARLRDVRDAVVASNAAGTSGALGLSMGMSRDLELAIAEGATTVRVGSAIFGARTPPTTIPHPTGEIS